MTTLDDIVRRVDDEVRRRGMVEDTFGREPHYTSDGRDGHDDYDCAAKDRAFLLTLVREAKVQVERLLDGTDRTEDDPARRFLLRLTEGSDRT